MRAWGDRLAVAFGVVMAAGSVAAQPVGAVDGAYEIVGRGFAR